MGYFVWHQFVVGATGWAALGLALVKPEPNHSGVVFFTCRKGKKRLWERDKNVPTHTLMWCSFRLIVVRIFLQLFQLIEPCCWTTFLTPLDILKEEPFFTRISSLHYKYYLLLTDASNNPPVWDGGNNVRVSFGASVFLRLQHVVGILKDRIVRPGSDYFKLLKNRKLWYQKWGLVLQFTLSSMTFFSV